ncbi:CaiB/BaiF CoA-transferase family protein [Algiphilus sp.]|uniref:CaiB/BaiF CoA transferase family protein n=1 Tax=Algiphilus sp. TaxID=1872431 RepID=UPI0032ECE06D
MKALDGITILDLTHMLSGPYGTMLLADLGATTIKVEPPGRGEGTRKLLATAEDYSLNGMGAYFLTLARNKQSVCIDLKSEEGLQLFYRMVEKADIVFDNFSAGVTERLKINHDRLAEINPGIITCTITGFGETGPDPLRPAFDQVLQGMGGGMSITGHPDSEPVRSGIPIGDLAGGMFGAMGVLAALVARGRTGRGQHIDVSMLDCQISLLNYMATMFFLSGKNPERLGNAHFVHVPYNTFKTADDYIIIAVIFDSFWDNLMEVIDVPELKDEKYRAQPGRFEDRDFINRKIEEVLVTKPAQYWLQALRDKRIPCAPVNNFEQALSDPQVLFRNMVVSVPHPEGGEVRMPGNPMKMSETGEESYSAPPLLGQQTDEVLDRLLGMSEEDIAKLRAAGIVA